MFIGNQQIQQYFNNLIKSENLTHAYLFYGPEGVGKKLLAFKISELIAGPSATNPDLRIIDKGKDEIHIADVRELKNFIHLTPFGKYKIAIINDAHNLGRDASNALLKILEEPPGKSILFLISHLPKMLLPTVVSRCQLMRFKPLKEQDIFNHLVGSGGKIKKDVAETCSKLSNGSLGSALELADNFVGFQKNINLLSKLMKSEFGERFETAKKISAGEDIKKIVGDWLVWSASLPDKKIARGLLYLNNVLSKPQFNHRLVLDNFMIKL